MARFITNYRSHDLLLISNMRPKQIILYLADDNFQAMAWRYAGEKPFDDLVSTR